MMETYLKNDEGIRGPLSQKNKNNKNYGQATH